MQIPGEVAFASLHVHGDVVGTVAGLQSNQEFTAEQAVHVLFEKVRHGIRGRTSHPKEIVLPLRLLAGESCPGLRA